MPVQVQCTMLDAWDWCTGTTQRDDMGREEGGGFRMDFLLKIKKKKRLHIVSVPSKQRQGISERDYNLKKVTELCPQ